jgi:two-component system response regulator FixJ
VIANRPVYVIDDDPAVLRSIEFLLSSLGHDSRCFAASQAFLEAVDSLPPGCILTDLRMPEMNGYELVQALSARSIHWPAILISSENGAETRVKASAAGFTAYLSKPFTADELSSTLELCLSSFEGETRQGC